MDFIWDVYAVNCKLLGNLSNLGLLSILALIEQNPKNPTYAIH
jgi:hypothetical protein